MTTPQELEAAIKARIEALSQCQINNQCMGMGGCQSGQNPVECYSELEGERNNLAALQAAIAALSDEEGYTGKDSLRQAGGWR